MTRQQVSMAVRAGTLILGLVAGHFLAVSPLWRKAAVESQIEKGLANDFRRVDAEWAQLVSRLFPREPAPSETRVAELLARRPAFPAGGLERIGSVVPLFLEDLSRAGETFGVHWTVIRCERPKPVPVALTSGESMTAEKVSLDLHGQGGYASLGRAIRDLEGGSYAVAVREARIRASAYGAVKAELKIDLFGAP
jgi:hypothetical protein